MMFEFEIMDLNNEGFKTLEEAGKPSEMVQYRITIASEYAAPRAFHLIKSHEDFRIGDCFSYVQLRAPELASCRAEPSAGVDKKHPFHWKNLAHPRVLLLNFVKKKEAEVKKILEKHGRELLHIEQRNHLDHLPIERFQYDLQFIPFKKE